MSWRNGSNSWNGSSWNRSSSASWQNSRGSSAWQCKDEWNNHNGNWHEYPRKSQDDAFEAMCAEEVRQGDTETSSGGSDWKTEMKSKVLQRIKSRQEDQTYGGSSGSNAAPHSWETGGDVTVGASVFCYGSYGDVAFVGTTHLGKGTFVGIKLDKAKGFNDGSADGIRYFSCDQLHGVIVSLDRFHRGKFQVSEEQRNKFGPPQTPSTPPPPPPPARARSMQPSTPSRSSHETLFSSQPFTPPALPTQPASSMQPSSSSSSSSLPTSRSLCKKCKCDAMLEYCVLPHTCGRNEEEPKDRGMDNKANRYLQLRRSLHQREAEHQNSLLQKRRNAIMKVLLEATDGCASSEKIQKSLQACGVSLGHNRLVNLIEHTPELSREIGIDDKWVWLKKEVVETSNLANDPAPGASGECFEISSGEEEPDVEQWPDFENEEVPCEKCGAMCGFGANFCNGCGHKQDKDKVKKEQQIKDLQDAKCREFEAKLIAELTKIKHKFKRKQKLEQIKKMLLERKEGLLAYSGLDDTGRERLVTRLETVHNDLDSTILIDQPNRTQATKTCFLGKNCRNADAQEVPCIVCRKPQHVCCVEGKKYDPSRSFLGTLMCPLCRLREMDPFSPLRSIGDHGILDKCIVSAGDPDAKLQFTKLKEVWQDDDKVEIRSVALELQPQPDGWQFLGPRWPPQLTGIMQGDAVFEVPKKKVGHPRRENIYDVTKSVREGQNTLQLQIEWAGAADNQVDFMMAAVLVQTLSDEDICIQNCLDFELSTEFGFDPDCDWTWGKPVLSKECGTERASRIVKKLEEVDDEAEVLQTSSRMPARELQLKCPISQMLLETPVVGRQCQHLQCFDLMAYLATTRKQAKIEQRWKCPICERRARPEELTLDHLARYILQDEVWISRGERVADEEDIIRFNSDGSWERVQVAIGKKAEDDSGGEDALDIDSSDDSSQDVRMIPERQGADGDGNGAIKRKEPEVSDVSENKKAKIVVVSSSKEAIEKGGQLGEKKSKKEKKEKKHKKDKKDKKNKKEKKAKKTKQEESTVPGMLAALRHEIQSALHTETNSADGKTAGIENNILARLPEDVPVGHEAWNAVKWSQGSGGIWRMNVKGGIPFQTTLRAAGGSKEAAGRIARICYVKLFNGSTKEDVTSFRNELYKLCFEKHCSQSSALTERKALASDSD